LAPLVRGRFFPDALWKDSKLFWLRDTSFCPPPSARWSLSDRVEPAYMKSLSTPTLDLQFSPNYPSTRHPKKGGFAGRFLPSLATTSSASSFTPLLPGPRQVTHPQRLRTLGRAFRAGPSVAVRLTLFWFCPVSLRGRLSFMTMKQITP